MTLINFKKAIFIWAAITLGCLAAFIVCEAAMILHFWVQDGEFLSIEQKMEREKNAFSQELTGSQPACSFIDMLLPHPYVGFAVFDHPCRGIKNINRAGFFGPEFPLHKPKDKFVILLTGGSVTAQLAGMSGTPFQDILIQHFGTINGKQIVVLNGAQGAWKQPQQAILFLMYAEVIDAVITLDGFNEAVLFTMPGVRLEYPSGNFETVNPQLHTDYRELLKGWLSEKFYDQSRNSWWISHSRLAYFLSLKTRQWLYSGLDNEAQALNESSDQSLSDVRLSSYLTLFTFPAGVPTEQQYDKNLKLYQKFIRSIHTVSRQMGIKNAHFIQPIPAIGKALTEDEIKVVMNEDGFTRTYQRMTDGLLELNQEGIPVYSLLQIFKDVKQTFYIDPIHCDTTAINGKRPCYDMMAHAIADHIEREWNLQPAAPGNSHRKALN